VFGRDYFARVKDEARALDREVASIENDLCRVRRNAPYLQCCAAVQLFGIEINRKIQPEVLSDELIGIREGKVIVCATVFNESYWRVSLRAGKYCQRNNDQ